MFLPYTKTIKKREVLLMTLQKQILQKNAVGTAALACPSPYKTAWQRLKKQLTVPLLAALLVCGYNLLLGTPKAQAAEHKEPLSQIVVVLGDSHPAPLSHWDDQKDHPEWRNRKPPKRAPHRAHNRAHQPAPQSQHRNDFPPQGNN